MANQPPDRLQREMGLIGAVVTGLGSILGTGVFVSLGVAAGVAGPSVILAIAVAALVATCNGLSSAQLAANHPVSGGTYEYGYHWLRPSVGFTAGWMFLCAKSASAATAALGFAGYALVFFGVDGVPIWRIGLAVLAVVVLTVLTLGGIRRSSWANTVIVSTTMLSLLLFVVLGAPVAWRAGRDHFVPFFAPSEAGGSPVAAFLEATALMFVAYTGYGRIATLGEEVKDPPQTIPRAIIMTLLVSMATYFLVGLVGVGAVGAETIASATRDQAAPLEFAARQFDRPGLELLLALGATAAMLGVLLNLILGLSRVALAMGRRGDLPPICARLDPRGTAPRIAVLGVAAGIILLVMIGNVKTTWSFSAFTVLVYYAITNWAALKLSEDERRYPRLLALLGLASCLFLAFWVEPRVWLVGVVLIAIGLVWHRWRRARI